MGLSLLWSAKGLILSQVGIAFFFCSGEKPISPGHLGDTTFLPGQKTHITTFKCVINRL